MIRLKKLSSLIEKVKSFARKPIDAKKFALTFIGAMAGFFLLWTLLVFLFDPYLYYHRAWGLKNVLNNSRAQVPGVMRNFEFDTVLFGTSMCQNFKCSDINDNLQCRSVKATSSGLSSAALSRYFTTALRYNKKNLKRCLVGIDIWSFAKADENRRSSYIYLYQDRKFPLEYFYSADSAKAIWEMIETNISANFDRIAKHEINEDVMFSNKPRYKYNQQQLEKDVRKSKHSPPVPDAETLKRFERDLLAHIRQNPDIRFDLFLPPYSIYFWCLLRADGKLESYLKVRDAFMEMASRYPNVKIHDFQADFDIACTLDHYKDVTHYSPAVNTALVRAMKREKHIFAPAEFKRRTALIRSRSAEYQSAFDSLRKSKKTK